MIPLLQWISFSCNLRGNVYPEQKSLTPIFVPIATYAEQVAHGTDFSKDLQFYLLKSRLAMIYILHRIPLYLLRRDMVYCLSPRCNRPYISLVALPEELAKKELWIQR